MAYRKKTPIQQIYMSLREAKAERDEVLVAELQQLLQAVLEPNGPTVSRLLTLLRHTTCPAATHCLAQLLGTAGDVRVLRPLMQAAVNPVHAGFHARFLWACAEYDCTAYLSFFVRFLLTHPDADESMLAAVTVIEAMQGPFPPKVVKNAIIRLLDPNGRAKATPFEPLLTELFLVQAAYALLDKHFDRVDQDVKKEG